MFAEIRDYDVGKNVGMEMAKIDCLTALKVNRIKEPGMYLDGRGLYLQVTQGASGASKSWLLRYALNGKERQMGLGSLHDVSLAKARERRDEARQSLLAKRDPIEERRAQWAATAAASAKALTFDQCRDRYIAAHRAGWRNTKHATQWRNTLETYVTPVFGNVLARDVDTAMVLKVLEPIWSTKPETASRVRGRIEAILNWAKVQTQRDGENPARWRGHLKEALPSLGEVKKVAHHAALPFSEIPAFIKMLRERDAMAARALEFAILTAARTNEIIGAKWSEIDLAAKVWTVPGDRMKAAQEHRVPLSDAALAVLGEAKKVHDGEFVFPGERRATLSNMALLMLLRRMGRDDLTAHGFRATFRTWAGDQTNFPSDVIEAALAHKQGKLHESYQRGDLLDKRRRLMAAWADYCGNEAGQVVPIRNAS